MADRFLRASDGGFSLIELVVVVAVAAIVMAVLTLGIRQASDSFTLQRAANLAVGELRWAQAKAMAEGVDYTVEFYTASGGIRVWKAGVSSPVRTVLSPEWPSTIEMPSGVDNFPDCAPSIDSSHDCAVYKPLGYAVAGGEVILQASGSGSQLKVVVESASGRVKVER